MRTKQVLPLMLIAALAGCNPYVLAAKETYEVAADPRSLVTQATDTEAEAQIKADLLASPVSGTSALDVYCRQGVVVVAGLVPSALLGERRRHQGTNQSGSHRGPRPGVEPGRHWRLCGPCCSRRGRPVAGKCSEVHFRRTLGEWGRVRDVLHPNGHCEHPERNDFDVNGDQFRWLDQIEVVTNVNEVHPRSS